MKKTLLGTLLLALAVLMVGCSQEGTGDTGDEILEDPKAECERVDGEWKQFPNTCVDSCEYARSEGDMMCGQAMTDGCDCGPSRCWNGKTCVPN